MFVITTYYVWDFYLSQCLYGCPISVSISHMSGSGEEASINWLYDFYSPNIIG